MPLLRNRSGGFYERIVNWDIGTGEQENDIQICDDCDVQSEDEGNTTDCFDEQVSIVIMVTTSDHEVNATDSV